MYLRDVSWFLFFVAKKDRLFYFKKILVFSEANYKPYDDIVGTINEGR